MFSSIVKKESFELENPLTYGRVDELSSAVNNEEYNTVGASFTFTDRGNGHFKTVQTSTVQPDGFGVIQSIAFPEISFQLQFEGETNVREVGITGEGVNDDSAAFRYLATRGIPSVGNPGDKYYMTSKVATADVDFSFDMRGGQFIEDSDVGQLFQIRNNIQNTTNVTAFNSQVIELSERNVLTLASSTAYQPGDVVKVVCDDRIRPDVAVLRGEYKAEYAVVESKQGSSITLDRTLVLINASSTNIRIGRLPKRQFKFVNAKFSLDTERDSYSFPYHISCEGFILPEFYHLEAFSAAGIFVRTLSCFGAVGDNIKADNLLNDTPNGKFGYGVADFGSQESNWNGLHIGQCRHAYTTGGDDIVISSNPGLISYGGAFRCHVRSGVCTGATSFAWDTHPDGTECVFHDVVASAGRSVNSGAWTGGYQDSGQRNVLHKLTYMSNTASNAALSAPVYIGRDCHTPKVHQLDLYGSSLKIANQLQSVPKRIDIGQINIFADDISDRFLDISTPSTIYIREVNYYLNKDLLTSAADMNLINLSNTGLFTVKDFNIFANNNGTQIVTPPNFCLVRVNTSPDDHRGVFINFNIYCGESSNDYLGNARILNGRNGKILKGEINVNVYTETAPVPRTRELAASITQDTNLMISYKTHSSYGEMISSEIGSMEMTSGSEVLHFGPAGFPWLESTNRYPHKRLIKYVTSNNSTNQIIQVIKPAFNGQEFTLYVPSTSQSFEIIGNCPGLHSDWSGTNVTFAAGRSYTFVARWDSVGSEYLWDYLP